MRPPLLLAYTSVVLVLALTAHAAESVTLRGGFVITCIAHEALSAETVRLHLPGDRGGVQNYVDVPAGNIVTVEAAPEPILANGVANPHSSVSNAAALLQQSGAEHNINVALLASVIQAESGGHTYATSPAGARGLMQLMPGTAAQYHLTYRFSPEGNVNAGSAYLSDLLTRYHDNLLLALAAYNAGPSAVDRYHGIPPFHETQLYVARVVREFNRRVRAAQQPVR